MEVNRQGGTAMVYAILFGGIFLGFIFGVVIMALLSIASLPSKPKRDRQSGAILLTPIAVPASLALRWRTVQRASELGHLWP
jgi:hypothetical protein